MIISLELYRIFCETAKAANITKAAEKLYVSQSAVSQAIMQLEERLECKLFNRSRRGVRLTSEGEVLYWYVNNAVSLIENAQDKLASMRDLRSGEIKIGASDTACSLFLLSVLNSFNAQNPDIHISVVNRVTRELIKLLVNGTVDMSLVNLPVEDEDMFDIHQVMELHDCFVVGEKYAFLAESVLQLRDLREYPVLMLERSSNSRNQMDIFLQSHGLEIVPSIELESLALIAEFAKIGLGIAATIREDVQKALDARELYELRFVEPLPIRYLGLAQMKNITLSFAAEAFKNAILA